VQEIGRHLGTGWFWYGEGRNTANEPVPTVDEAKKQAEEHVKSVLAARIADSNEETK
jgi:hypothetical protein